MNLLSAFGMLHPGPFSVAYILLIIFCGIYRVIHKSVKHLKNSQQINYSTPCDFFFWGFVKDAVFVPPLPANLQIFATVSPLLWLWSTVICWHACGTRWTIAEMSAVLSKVDTLRICEICKKDLESFFLYRHKNYHDPLSSLFVVNF